MSALDLFASALGAFMLLAVVFFPFFPNAGSSEERLEDVKKQLEEAIEKKDTAEREKVSANDAKKEAEDKTKEVEKEIAELDKHPINFPDIDIVFALDTTGSMGATVNSLKSEIGGFAALMSAWAPSVGIGMIDYKDQCEVPDKEIRRFELVQITPSTLSRLQAFANLASSGGSCNPTTPESMGKALDVASNMAWRSISKIRMIVIIADAPPYDNERVTTQNAAQAFNARGNAETVSVVLAGGSSNTEVYLRELVAAGGGELVKGKVFTASILKIIGKL